MSRIWQSDMPGSESHQEAGAGKKATGGDEKSLAQADPFTEEPS